MSLKGCYEWERLFLVSIGPQVLPELFWRQLASSRQGQGWPTGKLAAGLPVARLYLGNTWSDSTVVQQSHQIRVRLLGPGNTASINQSQAEAAITDQWETWKVRQVVARVWYCLCLCVASDPCSSIALYPSILSSVRLSLVSDPYHPQPHYRIQIVVIIINRGLKLIRLLLHYTSYVW